MIRELPNFIKCAVANRYSFLGYAALITSAFLFKENPENLNTYNFLALAGLNLLFTKGGELTHSSYRRTKNHIAKFNRIDKRFVRRFDKDYCVQLGIRLAAREAGLEEQLD